MLDCVWGAGFVIAAEMTGYGYVIVIEIQMERIDLWILFGGLVDRWFE